MKFIVSDSLNEILDKDNSEKVLLLNNSNELKQITIENLIANREAILNEIPNKLNLI